MYRSDSQLNPALTELRLLFVHSVAPRVANGGDSVRVVGLRRGGAAPHGIRTALPLHRLCLCDEPCSSSLFAFHFSDLSEPRRSRGTQWGVYISNKYGQNQNQHKVLGLITNAFS